MIIPSSPFNIEVMQVSSSDADILLSISEDHIFASKMPSRRSLHNFSSYFLSLSLPPHLNSNLLFLLISFYLFISLPFRHSSRPVKDKNSDDVMINSLLGSLCDDLSVQAL
jgi:hypothetical protein